MHPTPSAGTCGPGKRSAQGKATPPNQRPGIMRWDKQQGADAAAPDGAPLVPPGLFTNREERGTGAAAPDGVRGVSPGHPSSRSPPSLREGGHGRWAGGARLSLTGAWGCPPIPLFLLDLPLPSAKGAGGMGQLNTQSSTLPKGKGTFSHLPTYIVHRTVARGDGAARPHA